jgi:hypothetical protein
VNNFDRYYNTQFRGDIQKFFSTIPDESRFHEDKEHKQIFSIQYGRLTREYNHLNFLTTNQDKVNFAVALFFTVLVDEVCYTYYRANYDTFQKLTRYPKFIGNCLTMCRYHLPPSDIFIAMNKDKDGSSSDYLVFYDTFFEAIPVMERETKDFLQKYMSDVSGKEFWDKCEAEFPYRTVAGKSEL